MGNSSISHSTPARRTADSRRRVFRLPLGFALVLRPGRFGLRSRFLEIEHIEMGSSASIGVTESDEETIWIASLRLKKKAGPGSKRSGTGPR